jgi:putative oxidoreductase
LTYNQKIWNILLLILRLWLGYRLITASLSSVTGILTSANERAFFAKWFGEELHFPFPVLMAFLAKGSELAGGIFLILGLFSKASASLVAFTMLIATLTANLGKDFVIDGGFTISYFMFALIFIVWGAGKYSLDYLLFGRVTAKEFKRPYLPKEMRLPV